MPRSPRMDCLEIQSPRWWRNSGQQSAAFRQLIPCRTREIERRQTLAARSRSFSFPHPHTTNRAPLREEPSPMAPTHKDWGPSTYPPACQHQRKRLDLSSTAKTSSSQAPSSNFRFFVVRRGLCPPLESTVGPLKRIQLSLQSPGSNIDCLAAECASSSIGVSHHSECPLRQSACLSLQGSRDGPRVWQGRLVYDGPQSCHFVASSRARYASCWNESCRKHASGSYTTKHSDLNTCISRSYGRREFSVLGNSNTCGDITAADGSLEAIKGVWERLPDISQWVLCTTKACLLSTGFFPWLWVQKKPQCCDKRCHLGWGKGL